MKAILNTLLFMLTLTWLQPVAAEDNTMPQRFAYVLQADALNEDKTKVIEQLANSKNDWFILDTAFSGDSDWTADDLKTIKADKVGRKILAYLSIGEAEDYRDYWQEAWDSDGDGKPEKEAPLWLQSENPEWAGNYKVSYWHKDWQALILKRLNDLMQQGFDGVYLDIVDAFEFFEYDQTQDKWLANKVNSATGNTYRQDMLSWVKQIAEQARKLKPDALIVPQNASALLADESYVNMINAIGVEDLFTNDDVKQVETMTTEVLAELKPILAQHKPVLVIEYAQDKVLRQYAQQQTTDKGLLLLLPDRELKTLE